MFPDNSSQATPVFRSLIPWVGHSKKLQGTSGEVYNPVVLTSSWRTHVKKEIAPQSEDWELQLEEILLFLKVTQDMYFKT